MKICKNCKSPEKCESQNKCEKKRLKEHNAFMQSLNNSPICSKQVCDCDKKDCK